MTEIPVESTDLESCLSRAQRERLILTRKGKPVAMEGIDREQVELGASAKLEKKANGAGH